MKSSTGEKFATCLLEYYVSRSDSIDFALPVSTLGGTQSAAMSVASLAIASVCCCNASCCNKNRIYKSFIHRKRYFIVQMP